MRAGALLRALPALLVVILVLATFRDYGYSWDETWQNRWYGQAVLRFLATGGEDRSATTTNNFYLYGGTFDAAAELLVEATPLEPRNARHLANALAGLAGLAGCWALARRLGGRAAGAWAVLFLASCAPWYGHMFINAKDIPFAAGYAWSLALTLRALDELPRLRLSTGLALGLAIGLTLGVRIGGVLNLAYLLLAVAVVVGREARRRGVSAVLREDGARLTAGLATVGVVAWELMLVGWPAALLRPVAAPLEALRAASSFEWVRTVLWSGREVWSNDLPWSYLPVVLAVQLPEVLVVLFLAALGWAAVACARPGRGGLRAGVRSGIALVLLAALFPPAWAMAMGSTLYDNGRHFLFVLPPLAALAAVAWSRWLRAARVTRRGLALAAALGLVGALVLPVARMAALHPYEYAYLNALGGGVPGGATRFDTEYWITSYREAARALSRHATAAAAASGHPLEAMRFSVAVYGPPEILAEELPRGFEIVPFEEGGRADYLVATTRWRVDRSWPDYPEIASVGRAGMRFAVVKASPALARLAGPVP